MGTRHDARGEDRSPGPGAETRAQLGAKSTNHMEGPNLKVNWMGCARGEISVRTVHPIFHLMECRVEGSVSGDFFRSFRGSPEGDEESFEGNVI